MILEDILGAKNVISWKTNQKTDHHCLSKNIQRLRCSPYIHYTTRQRIINLQSGTFIIFIIIIIIVFIIGNFHLSIGQFLSILHIILKRKYLLTKHKYFIKI